MTWTPDSPASISIRTYIIFVSFSLVLYKQCNVFYFHNLLFIAYIQENGILYTNPVSYKFAIVSD